jgi:2-amino-4-hydroxy-6-hydroxymethyldihydropteridine diphosphokinase
MKRRGIFILLGTNLGNKVLNLEQARAALERQAGVIKKASSLYKTSAWGKTDQPDFLNQVTELESELSPQEMLRTILSIELDMGRTRTEHWGSRLIDIDILLYGDVILDSAELRIPHPQMINRRFTLTPLAEIAADVVHPVHKKKIHELLALCPDPLEVIKL